MRIRRGLDGAATLAVLWGLVACSDGYPTEDAPQTDLAQMSQAQLLAALNALGEGAHLPQRWRYALKPGCRLEVRARGEPRELVALPEAELEMRSDDGFMAILLVPGDAAEAVTVLRTAQWSDTVEARSLLAHLQTRCAPAEG